jgi:hypothetical protein
LTRKSQAPAPGGRDLPAEIPGQDQVAGAGEARQIGRHEIVRGVADRPQRLAGRGQRDRMRGMRVHHAADVGARDHDFGVDGVFAVPRPVTLEDLAVLTDQVHPLRDHLLQSPAGGFQPHAVAVRVPGRRVSPDEIALPGGGQDS